jgi:sugar diacid utilization regulator
VRSDPGLAALRDALEERLEALADQATDAIIAEIPAYGNADRQLRQDIRAHVLSHLQASLDSLGADRDVTPEDLLFVRPHAARRARRVSVADFVHAFYVGERVLWDAVLALAADDDSRHGALVFASHLPRYFEIATTHAAEVYLEAQEQLAATGERIRRDLLEDLLAGRELEPGPQLDAARAAGLRPASPCLVISAVPRDTADDEQLLRGGAAALARAGGAVAQPLAVVRRDEIVVILPVDELAEGFHVNLERAQQRLADGGLPLTVGVSTTVAGPEQVPDAYREATMIRMFRGSRPGVTWLTGMSALDYLTLRADGTASRLIAPEVHEFVTKDAQEGGPLIATLREYMACDLNARRASEALHIHVNTAHYRLARIAERTGCDLRRVGDLIEILIAARLADKGVPGR